MNPMTNMKNVLKLSQQELQRTFKTTWHDQYRNSAWIFIGGLPYDLTEGDIICVFSQYGEIVNINLVRDKDSGKQKGFCFVCYEDQRSTDLAVDNFNGIKILGRTIRVDHVNDYKMPKDKKNSDAETRKLQEEGCGPNVKLEKRPAMPIPSTELPDFAKEIEAPPDGFKLPPRLPIGTIKIEKEDDESEVHVKKEPKDKKKKKSKKKHKKKHVSSSESSSESSSSSSEESSSEEEQKKSKKSKKAKKEKKKTKIDSEEETRNNKSSKEDNSRNIKKDERIERFSEERKEDKKYFNSREDYLKHKREDSHEDKYETKNYQDRKIYKYEDRRNDKYENKRYDKQENKRHEYGKKRDDEKGDRKREHERRDREREDSKRHRR